MTTKEQKFKTYSEDWLFCWSRSRVHISGSLQLLLDLCSDISDAVMKVPRGSFFNFPNICRNTSGTVCCGALFAYKFEPDTFESYFNAIWWVILIDSLEKSPLLHSRVHYIQGNPVQVETLEKANMAKVKAVFIFSDEITRYQNMIRDPAFIDGKTLLVAATIERNYPYVYSIVEIRDKENLANF